VLSFWSGREPVAASGLAQASVHCVRYGSSAQRDTLGESLVGSSTNAACRPTHLGAADASH
jgi:hypothetical protein